MKVFILSSISIHFPWMDFTLSSIYYIIGNYLSISRAVFHVHSFLYDFFELQQAYFFWPLFAIFTCHLNARVEIWCSTLLLAKHVSRFGNRCLSLIAISMILAYNKVGLILMQTHGNTTWKVQLHFFLIVHGKFLIAIIFYILLL